MCGMDYIAKLNLCFFISVVLMWFRLGTCHCIYVLFVLLMAIEWWWEPACLSCLSSLNFGRILWENGLNWWSYLSFLDKVVLWDCPLSSPLKIVLKFSVCRGWNPWLWCIGSYVMLFTCIIPFYIILMIIMVHRILLTNILRLSWLTLPTIRPAMTQGSIGSAILFTSTGNCADSPLLEKSTEVSGGRDTCITRQDLQEGQHGRGTTLSPFGVTVDLRDILAGVTIGVVISAVRVTFFKKLCHRG